MSTDSQIAFDNYDRYCYVRDTGHLQFVKKARECREYFFGRQWDPSVKAFLEAAKRPAFTINEVFAQLVTVMGEHIENRADVSFVETASGTPEVAHALTKTLIHIQQSNGHDMLESQMFMSGMITSRGFIDVRPAFNDQLQGEVRYTYLKSQNVLVDPDADTYDPDHWKELFITYWLSPLDIEMNYGKDFARELESRQGSVYAYGYDSVDFRQTTFGGSQSMGPGYVWSADPKVRRYIRVIERQHKEIRQAEHFVDPETGDMRAIPLTWDRNKIAYVREQFGLEVFKMPKECIRWTVSADDMLLHHEMSPLKHFTVVPFFPYFFEGQSSGLVEQLKDPQDILNKSLSSEVHILNSVANSGWQIEEGSIVNMTEEELRVAGAETGLVIVRRPGSQPAEKIAPNQVPTGFDRIGYKAIEYLKELSGVSDSKRGFDRADVAAKAILAKQKASSINLTLPLNNLIQSRRLIARNTLDIIQTYYTEERVFRITNARDPASPSQEVVVNQYDPATGQVVNDLTLGEYTVVITDVPSRETFMDSQFQEALQLREIGIPIPDAVLIKHSHLQDKTSIVQQLEAPPSPEQQAMQQLQAQLAQLEVQEKEASILKTKADAALVLARAKVQTKEATGGDSTAEQEAMKQAQELVLQREKQQADIALQRERMVADIALQRDRMRQEMMLNTAKTEQELALKEKQYDLARKNAGAEAEAQGRSDGKRENRENEEDAD
ncbi:MAG: hypothetical protein RLZ44_617 [Pseudomonadota bacterium]